MRTPALFVFDLAGTVIADDDRVLGVFRDTLQALDVPDPLNLCAKMMGCSKAQVFQAISPRHAEALQVEFEFRMLKSYEERPAIVIEGVYHLLNEILGRDIRVAFNTGFPHMLATKIIRQANISHHHPVVSSCQVRCGRPHPHMIHRAMEWTGVADVRSVAVVGDTRNDAEAGHNSGAGWVIGVRTGSEKEWAEPHHCTHVVHSVGDIMSAPFLCGGDS